MRIAVVHRVTNCPGPVIPNRTPFGHKNRQPMRYGVISIRCIIAARSPIIRIPRVEMEGIGDIRVINRTTNDITGPRRPLRRTHHNQVVGIAANNGNHFLRIGLDFGPSNHATILIAHVTRNIGPCAMTRFAKGFIEYLENHVVISAPLLCLNLEKFLSTIDIFRSDVGMVVDNHVDVILDSRLDRLVKHVLVVLGLTIHKVMAIAPSLQIHRHGGTDYLNALPAYFSRNHIVFPVTLISRILTPEKAHALYLDLVSAGAVCGATPVNAALVLSILARHQLAVLAYRPCARRRDVSVRGGEDAQGKRTQGYQFGKAEF